VAAIYVSVPIFKMNELMLFTVCSCS